MLRARPEEADWADAIERFYTLGSSGARKGPSDLRGELRIYKKRIPSDTLPVASDDEGNLILLGIEGKNLGKVFFWSHNEEAGTPLGKGRKPGYENVTLVAGSFDEFLAGLKPFEPEG